MIDLLAWIVLGGLVGWAASVVMRTRKQGCITDVVVGIAGAFVGGALINLISGRGLRFTGELNLNLSSLLTAFVGAVIVLAVIRAIR